MKLLIDIGNTSSKFAVADGERIFDFAHVTEPWQDVLDRIHRTYTIERIVVSCVGHDGLALQEALKDRTTPTLWLSAGTPCSIKGVPAGYGADRLAADLGAYTSQSALLVVDAGTCITYDLIVNGRLMGGVISPGVQLRLNAMHDYTAALPLIDGTTDATPSFMGNDTASCMLSAAYNGARFEIEGYIKALRLEHPDLEVVLTGGTRFTFASDIRCTYDPILVLKGLNKLEGGFY